MGKHYQKPIKPSEKSELRFVLSPPPKDKLASSGRYSAHVEHDQTLGEEAVIRELADSIQPPLQKEFVALVVHRLSNIHLFGETPSPSSSPDISQFYIFYTSTRQNNLSGKNFAKYDLVLHKPKNGSRNLPALRYLNTETQRHRGSCRYDSRFENLVFTHLVKLVLERRKVINEHTKWKFRFSLCLCVKNNPVQLPHLGL